MIIFISALHRKKKKKKDKEKKMLAEAVKNEGEGSEGSAAVESRVDTRTPAERAFQKAREKRVSILVIL